MVSWAMEWGLNKCKFQSNYVESYNSFDTHEDWQVHIEFIARRLKVKPGKSKSRALLKDSSGNKLGTFEDVILDTTAN